MKKGKKLIICLLIAVALLSGVYTLSSDAALRFAVFWNSPIKVVTMSYKKIDSKDINGTLYRITKNEPVEKATDGHLYTWIVHELGPYHFAEYYGEG